MKSRKPNTNRNDVTDLPVAQLKLPKLRVALTCDPATPPQLPDQFFGPNAPKAPDPVITNIPTPITVGNIAIAVKCSDFVELGPVGDNVSVAPFTFNDFVFFQQIPDITVAQLGFIYSLTRDKVSEIVTSVDALDYVINLKLTEVQATHLLNSITSITETLNRQAHDYAKSLLSCVWLNSTTSVACEGNGLTTSLPTVSVNNPSVVLGGSVKSTLSQADVDERATILATSALVCVYTNEAVTVNCTALGFQDAVPNDDPGRDARIGSVTVVAGQFFATTQAAANEQATASALSALDCFYKSAPLTISCEDVGAVGAVTIPFRFDAAQQGNPITLPLGAITSVISQADADANALLLAKGLLKCVWRNVARTETCPTVTVANIPYEPSRLKSPVYSVGIAEGAIESTVSQADADDQAHLAAQAQLVCYYCNVGVSPICLPPDVSVRNPLTIPIPLEWVGPSWSLDATLGILPNAFCSTIPGEAQMLAANIANTPTDKIVKANDCRYGNDLIKAGCVADPDNNVIGKFSDPSVRATLSELSSPNPRAVIAANRIITVGENSLIIQESNVPSDFVNSTSLPTPKAYANSLAQNIALSLLDCFFGNQSGYFTCDTIGMPDADEASRGHRIRYPIYIPPNTFRSYVSLYEADALARLQGIASMDCFVTNDDVTADCKDLPKPEKKDPPPLDEEAAQDAADDAEAARRKALFLPESAAEKERQDSRKTVYHKSAVPTFTFPGTRVVTTKDAAGNVISSKIVPGAITSKVSKAQANSVALAIAQSSLRCIYTNSRGFVGGCEPGDIVISLPVVKVGTMKSTESTRDANLQAKISSQLYAVCASEATVNGGGGIDGLKGQQGLPGNDGKQAACKGNCFGYYS